MPLGAGDLDRAEGKIRAGSAKKHAGGEDRNQKQARWNRRSLEVFNFAGGVGKFFRGNIIARQTADAAGNEVNQNNSVKEPAHPDTIGEHGRTDAKTDDIGERIQFTAKGRMLVPPTRDSSGCVAQSRS